MAVGGCADRGATPAGIGAAGPHSVELGATSAMVRVHRPWLPPEPAAVRGQGGEATRGAGGQRHTLEAAAAAAVRLAGSSWSGASAGASLGWPPSVRKASFCTGRQAPVKGAKLCRWGCRSRGACATPEMGEPAQPRDACGRVCGRAWHTGAPTHRIGGEGGGGVVAESGAIQIVPAPAQAVGLEQDGGVHVGRAGGAVGEGLGAQRDLHAGGMRQQAACQ